MIFNKDRAKSLLLEFSLAGVPLSDQELRRFLRLDQLLSQNMDQLDLTRTDPRQLIQKHYLDSAKVADFLPEPGTLLDLGSGAGFPGLPLAIRNPHWTIILAEPRLKRLAFLEEAIDLLGLANVQIYPHKVNPLTFSVPIKALIARDFGPLNDLLEIAAAILPENGQLFLLKGPRVAQEIALAQKNPAWANFTDLTVKYYQIGPHERSFLALTKKSPNSVPPPAYSSLEIASRQNPRFRSWLKLLTGRQQRRLGETLAFGQKIIQELLTNQGDLILGIIATKPRDLVGYPLKSHYPVFFLRPEIFPELDVLGTGPPIVWLKTPTLPAWELNQTQETPWLLVPFQDPKNVGAVIRTAAALKAAVVLLSEAASPFHFRALRTGGSAIFETDLYQGPSYQSLPDLPRDDIFALSPRGQDIFKVNCPKGLGLALGVEGPGLDSLWPWAKKLAIPMNPRVESLNGATAAAMALAILKTRSLN
ncbi:MAG: 16S rRNA (guanine(527)-N(7))-methyltransferase RsmG [Deltaproteobacteria bacterium]|jgi:16S rRNA (guanine527-N7)-methyltransferase|nr:16S rRNA (guanine(527)-N(7))-methyltransferase RsmG [Deltaproteobacteria bacterium]